jgi:hypothetical protein
LRSSATLDRVWRTHQTTGDCFRVAQLAIVQDAAALLSRTDFVGASTGEAEARIVASRDESDNLAILALWGAFERDLAEQLGTRLHHKVERSIERWNEDLLRVFEGTISDDLLTAAKKIRVYRNWVAHRNPTASPDKTDPRTAYEILAAILDELAGA